ncbi:MAG: FKBP-type peptidyl-prolyl cis-trans isomerase [Streptomycetaceae bacterium]|nr:FKBP-type peptidyl-prolyl cis-trans isomerase [Streptomycetaceae bacterium]
MRRLATLLLVPALLLGAAACGSDSKDDKGDTTSRQVPVSTTGAVTANSAFGQPPNIAIPEKVKPPKDMQVQVLTEGSGPVVDKNNMATFNYEGVSWSSRRVFDSSFEAGRTPFTVPDLTSGLIQGWLEAMPGKKVGTRLLMTIPPDKGYGPDGNPPKIAKNETLVFVVDLVDTVGKMDGAQGTAVNVTNADLPKVQTEGVKVTGVTFPKDKPAPTAVVKQPLIEGTGAAVTPTDTVTMQTVQYVWGADKTIGSSWGGSGPTQVSLATGSTNLMKTLADSLAGVKVGSRVMLVIPPDKAFGAEGNQQAGVPANASLVLVLDILRTAQVSNG